MGENTYRDWIPAGEDPGAQGKIYQDFVPPAVPQKKEELKVEEIVAEKKTEYKCEVCGKIVSSPLALAGHSRSHK